MSSIDFLKRSHSNNPKCSRSSEKCSGEMLYKKYLFLSLSRCEYRLPRVPRAVHRLRTRFDGNGVEHNPPRYEGTLATGALLDVAPQPRWRNVIGKTPLTQMSSTDFSRGFSMGSHPNNPKCNQSSEKCSGAMLSEDTCFYHFSDTSSECIDYLTSSGPVLDYEHWVRGMAPTFEHDSSFRGAYDWQTGELTQMRPPMKRINHHLSNRIGDNDVTYTDKYEDERRPSPWE